MGFCCTSLDSCEQVICTIVVLGALVTVGLLLAWHVYLLLHNKTTIEYHEGVRARWLAEKAGQHYRHPYDVGVFTNLSMALGHSVACWLCPTATGHLGSGLQFRTFSDDLAHTQQSLSHGWIASPLKVAITTCNQWLKSRFRGWVWQLKKMIWMVWRSEVLGFFQHRGSFHNEVTR
jgi:hypothetical protein